MIFPPPLRSRESDAHQDLLAPYILRGLDHEEGVCLDFIKEAISRFPEDDQYAAVFTDAMVKLSTDLSKLTMNDDYKSYMDVSVAIA